MFLQISDVLQAAEVQALRDKIASDQPAFGDGRKSAGWHAREVKHNEQAEGHAARAVGDFVEVRLRDNPVFKAAAMPKSFVKLLVSRYRPGMAYGTHVDDALMGGLRTDLSFTLFLTDPTSYDGGALLV